MKKVLVLLMTGLFAVSMIQGQTQQKEKARSKETKQAKKTEMVPLKKLTGTVVSDAAKDNFAAKYGNIPGTKWVRSEYFDAASFTKDGKNMVAFYDSDGALVGTTTNGNYSDLPKKGQEEISVKYKGYVPGTVVFYKDDEMNPSDMILYDHQFEDEDNYFVELTKGGKTIVVMVSPEGEVSYFTGLK